MCVCTVCVCVLCVVVFFWYDVSVCVGMGVCCVCLHVCMCIVCICMGFWCYVSVCLCCVCVCLHVCSLHASMYNVSLFIPEPGMDTCGTDA